MNITRFAIKACCGSASLGMKLSQPLSIYKNFLPLLMDGGFPAAKNYSQAGILYIETESFIAQGVFNSNILQIKCKRIDKCQERINDLEDLLKIIGEKSAQTEKGERY